MSMLISSPNLKVYTNSSTVIKWLLIPNVPVNLFVDRWYPKSSFGTFKWGSVRGSGNSSIRITHMQFGTQLVGFFFGLFVLLLLHGLVLFVFQ